PTLLCHDSCLRTSTPCVLLLFTRPALPRPLLFSPTRRSSDLPPTTLTRMSMRPNRSTHVAMSRAAGSSSVRSPATATAVPPAAAIDAAVRSSPAASRSPSATRAPSRASSCAISRPRPLAAPVTTATRSRTPAMSLPPRSGMRGDPVACDVEAAREPDALMAGHVVEHAFQPRRAGGMPDQPQMKPQRQHLGPRSPLPVEHVEPVLHEREVVRAGEEPSAPELRIVRRQAVRHDEVRALADARPVRKLVVVRVGIVE